MAGDNFAAGQLASRASGWLVRTVRAGFASLRRRHAGTPIS
jgi:hypothetical protein